MSVTVDIDTIQPAFNNAHRELWKKYNSEGRILTSREIELYCKQWWSTEYNVVIHNKWGSPVQWARVEFPTEEAITYFMLKWS
ncbi:MAG: hypothetical protein ACOVLB_02030 [Candidatus Nanopelagicus sp.]